MVDRLPLLGWWWWPKLVKSSVTSVCVCMCVCVLATERAWVWSTLRSSLRSQLPRLNGVLYATTNTQGMRLLARCLLSSVMSLIKSFRKRTSHGVYSWHTNYWGRRNSHGGFQANWEVLISHSSSHDDSDNDLSLARSSAVNYAAVFSYEFQFVASSW